MTSFLRVWLPVLCVSAVFLAAVWFVARPIFVEFGMMQARAYALAQKSAMIEKCGEGARALIDQESGALICVYRQR